MVKAPTRLALEAVAHQVVLDHLAAFPTAADAACFVSRLAAALGDAVESAVASLPRRDSPAPGSGSIEPGLIGDSAC